MKQDNCNCPLCTKTPMEKFKYYKCKNSIGATFGMISHENKDEALKLIQIALEKRNKIKKK